jgi:hypothetical protein
VTTPNYVQDNAASVRGRALRVTTLGSDGAPAVGTSCDVYLTGGFISFQFTPAYSDGDEIEVKNAAGETCVYYKLPDTLKNVGLQLQLCDPDVILTQMLVGGTVLAAAGNSAYAPAGTEAGDLVAVGYASELAGHAATPNGVAVEVWADAIINSRSASRAPYWHYLFPSAQFKLDGDRVIENGNLATQFAGTGVGNSMFGTGPNMDLTGVTPTPAPGAWDWAFPEYTQSPFLYARTFSAPIGLKGQFNNQGVPIVAIIAGDPATFNPVNATRPANLAELQALGALGNVGEWGAGSVRHPARRLPRLLGRRHLGGGQRPGPDRPGHRCQRGFARDLHAYRRDGPGRPGHAGGRHGQPDHGLDRRSVRRAGERHAGALDRNGLGGRSGHLIAAGG